VNIDPNDRPEEEDPPMMRGCPAGDVALEVRDLNVRLPSGRRVVHAVDGASLILPAGQSLGLVGESGCGKSMFGYAVMGLLPRRAVLTGRSEIYFHGTALHRLDKRQRRHMAGSRMAMIFQDPVASLNPVMKIGHQVAEGLIEHRGMTRRHALDSAAGLLEAVGIDRPSRRIRQYPHQLSGGICQRVAIAMALSCRPGLLIADEPTTAMDVFVQAGILDLLATYCRRERMALILISHDLGVAADRTRDIAVMYAGRIVEYNRTDTLFTRPRMPYTRALLEAAPRLSAPAHADLKSIAGSPPDLTSPPSGCRFYPRCAYARPKCKVAAPPFRCERGTHYGYACWYPLRRGSRRSIRLSAAAAS
jgi:oligopeptide/dipeptide ABC transporter ATP-binding protein